MTLRFSYVRSIRAVRFAVRKKTRPTGSKHKSSCCRISLLFYLIIVLCPWPIIFYLFCDISTRSFCPPPLFKTTKKPPMKVWNISLGSPLFGQYSYWNGLFGFQAIKDRKTIANFSHGASCRLVDDHSTADAIVFYAGETTDNMLKSASRHRTAKQRWIFLSAESAANSALQMSRMWYSAFNWTATYRRDSDIWMPYTGRIEERKYSTQFITHRPKRLAFAVISNCNARYRLDIIYRLRALYPDVDLYGRCGGTALVRGYEAIHKLSENYYFYLAFENSMCLDYISEKFWMNGLCGSAVPVALGGLSRAEYEAIAPPNSFLYAPDFSSISELGKAMKQISKNSTAYEYYQRWRRSKVTTLKDHSEVGSNFIEELSWRLQTDLKRKSVNIERFWSVRYNCDLRQNEILM